MQTIIGEFDLFWNNMEQFITEHEPSRMRLDSIQGEDRKDSYDRLFYEILDVIILKVTQRNNNKLTFLPQVD